MRTAGAIAVLLLLSTASLNAQTSRMASDFEIARMEQQLARSRDFVGQLSARLNLGDLRRSRNESALARAEYTRAAALAAQERIEARRAPAIGRYSSATLWAALASAKLGRESETFQLLEESLRYSAGNARSWNVYSSAMTLLGRSRKAASAARNAVAIAQSELAQSPGTTNRLDVAVYQYTLASALLDAGETAEAERLLVEVTSALRSSSFASLRREAEKNESFEIYSSARGDDAAYLSLLNRSQLRLAGLYEKRGDLAAARREYQHVLEARTDEPSALAGLARLASSSADRERYYREAFDANPFSLPLIRDYQKYLGSAGAKPEVPDANGTGNRMRRALQQLAKGGNRAALETLDTLLSQFPDNDALKLLRREADAVPASLPAFLSQSAAKGTQAPGFTTPALTPSAPELRQLMLLLAGDRLTPPQRQRLDQLIFRSQAAFALTAEAAVIAGQTTLASGSIGEIPFTFSEPTNFRGSFGTAPVWLTYRVTGATRRDDRDVLLLEPLGVEAIP